jgi:Holliday junction resolvase RusA-like endonuclease
VRSVPTIAFTVLGTPAPQGSKQARPIYKGRGAARQFTGKVAQVESSKAVQPWRDAVRAAAYHHRTALNLPPFTGPLIVRVTFYLPRPKSAPKSRWAADKRPDLDKLLRSTFDALGEAGIWGDDSQVIEVTAAKTFAELGKSLDVPGADIVVRACERQAS